MSGCHGPGDRIGRQKAEGLSRQMLKRLKRAEPKVCGEGKYNGSSALSNTFARVAHATTSHRGDYTLFQIAR